MRQGTEIHAGGLARILLVLSLGVLCFVFFYFIQPYHLMYDEQMQLFLFSSDYFLSYLSKPGWLACYVGDFLTQFYYFRAGGAIILSFVLGVELLLLLLVFNRMGRRENWLYAVLPVLIDWFLHTGLNYRLSSSIAFVFALFFFLLYTLINHKNLAMLLGLIFTPILYSLIGGHFLTFVILVIFYDIVKKRYMSFFYWLLLLIGCVATPVLLRESYLLTTKQLFYFPADRFSSFYPVIALTSLLIVYLISLNKISYRYQRKEFTTLFVLVVLSTIGIFIKADTKLEKLLLLDSETYFGNWEKVIRKSESYEMKNPIATYFANIAMMKQGELPDKLLTYYQPFSKGLFIPVGPESTPLEILFSGEVYFQLGDMNMAQHSTMLGMIFSPQHRSSRLIKRLTEINLIIGDTAAVDKYLRILDKTLFYRNYSSDIRQIMSDPENLWLSERRANIAAYDTLRIASDAEASLTMLLKSNSDNRAALDYLLCYHLLNKQIASFMVVYDKWFKGREFPLPDLYAEAVLIGLARQKTSAKILEGYGIPNEITTAFLTYTKQYEEAGGDGTNLQEEYAGTYWFYYHYAQMKEQ